MKSRTTKLNRAVVTLLASMALLAVASPSQSRVLGLGQSRQPMAALPPVPANTLPQIKYIDPDTGNASLETRPDNNQLIIRQNQKNSILSWNSFDIGKDAQVIFDQQGNTNWSSLNRIYDSKPSQIHGRLSADGEVYLINQNGMFFSRSSSFDVHSLVASSLNLPDPDFSGDFLVSNSGDRIQTKRTFSSAYNYLPGGAGDVVNEGRIQTVPGGWVMLLGANVENNGTIEAPYGRIVLSAGEDAIHERSISVQNSVINDTFNTEVTETGTAANAAGGTIGGDGTDISVFGRVINQEGIVRSITSIRKGGNIILDAEENIVTGSGSVTEIPVSDSGETYHPASGVPASSLLFTAGEAVVHRGTVSAPSNNVDMLGGRVFVGKGAVIDVKGEWAEKSAAANSVQVQLNSVELRDEFGHKTDALKGEIVTFNVLKGTNAGNVKTALDSRERTSREAQAEGGVITLKGRGDVIVEEGATIDISGGGIHYAAGIIDSTLVRVGETIVALDQVPDWQQVTAIAGTKSEFQGAYDEGRDAGALAIIAPQVIADPTLKAGVTVGPFQESGDIVDTNGFAVTAGRRRPAAGTLKVGYDTDNSPLVLSDPVVGEIVVGQRRSPALPAGFDPLASPFPEKRGGRTVISADMLRAAELARVSLSAESKLTIEAGTDLRLAAAGVFSGHARTVVHEGRITVPSGTVSLVSRSNVTSATGSDRYRSHQEIGPERVYLAPGSSIDVGGEKVDNALAFAQGRTVRRAFTGGGEVTLIGKAYDGDGVVVSSGSTISVSGGYQIDAGGAVLGGDAGAVTMSGRALVLEGRIEGLAHQGAKGGEIDLSAWRVDVTANGRGPRLPGDFDPDQELPTDLADTLVLASNQFAALGFRSISLRSGSGLTVEAGAVLQPSRVGYRLTPASGPAARLREEAIVLEEYEIPDSAVELEAGAQVKIDAWENEELGSVAPPTPPPGQALAIGVNAVVRAMPGGTVAAAGQEVSVAGTLAAPAGGVTLTSKAAPLRLLSTSQILSRGFNLPVDYLVEWGKTLYTPLDGGTVTINAGGGFQFDAGAIIDVSGAPAVEVVRRTLSGTDFPLAAGNSGSLFLSLATVRDKDGGSVFKGIMKAADAGLAGLRGGSVSLGWTASASDTPEVDDELLGIFDSAGFDEFSFNTVSKLGITLTGVIDRSFEGGLTFSTPMLRLADGARVSLAASAISLINPTGSYYYSGPIEPGSGELELSGGYLDVRGDVAVLGASSAHFRSDTDIILADFNYNSASNNGLESKWSGRLLSSGDLTLEASRIYPSTGSTFLIAAPAGRVTTLPGSGRVAPIQSAAGTLLVRAQDIVHNGNLSAPMGNLSLEADHRLYLSETAELSTTGEAMVRYGSFDEEGILWQSDARQGAGGVNGPPAKKITLRADELITREGSLIDASSGGSIFSYTFLAGAEGSFNPLTKNGRLVILPGDPQPAAGAAVYLEACPQLGIAAGTYRIMGEEYAFAAGAVILEPRGSIAKGYSGVSLSEEGYPLVAGFDKEVGGEEQDLRMTSYAVRRAEDVLKEGNFTRGEWKANDGGIIDLQGDTVILEGRLQAASAEDGALGELHLAARDIVVGETTASLGPDFEAETPLTGSKELEALVGKMVVDSAALAAAGGSGSLALGSANLTETIEVTAGSTLAAGRLALTARDSILVRAGATLANSVGGEGIELDARQGRLDIEGAVFRDGVKVADGAKVRASQQLTMSAKEVSALGDLEFAGQGVLTLASDLILVTPGDADGNPLPYRDRDGAVVEAFTVGYDLFGLASDLSSLSFHADSDLAFVGDGSLITGAGVVIDAPRIGHLSVVGETASIEAARIAISAPAGAPAAGPLEEEYEISSGDLDLNGARITMGSGDMAFAGMDRLSLFGADNVVFTGAGSLAVPGDLTIEAGRIIGQPFIEDDGYARALDFVLEAGGTLTTLRKTLPEASPEPVVAAAPASLFGRLRLTADSVRHGGTLILPGGNLSITATGEGTDRGVFLESGSTIDLAATGVDPAGRLLLQADRGRVEMESGSTIDLSATDREQAGRLSVIAPLHGLSLAGEVVAEARDGVGGGSLYLFTDTLADRFSALAAVLKDRFTEEIDLRARTGDIAIGASDTVKARRVKITADSGGIVVEGKIDASGAKQGEVSLCAARDLLLAGGSIDARNSGSGDGGSVLLSAGSTATAGDDSAGWIRLSGGAEIDAAAAEGTDGLVTLRAGRTLANDDVKMDLHGSLTGVSATVATAVRSYSGTTTVSTAKLITAKTDADGFMNTQANDAGKGESRLLTEVQGLTGETLHLVPGIEFSSDGDMEFKPNADLNLVSWLEKSSGDIGELTLRAAGSLTINKGIRDEPQAGLADGTSSRTDSWNINLVAGADLASPDAVAILPAAGAGGFRDLTVATGVMVYTQSGSLRFAAADTVKVFAPPKVSSTFTYGSMTPSLGTFDGPLSGVVGGDLDLRQGIIQSCLADISLDIGGRIVMLPGSAVRTVGAISSIFTRNLRSGGGSIDIRADGGVHTTGFSYRTTFNSSGVDAWDRQYQHVDPQTGLPLNLENGKPWYDWSADYGGSTEPATTGIVTLAGGDLSLYLLGDLTGAVGAFRQGDLEVLAHGDLNGRFLLAEGTAQLLAGGNFGLDDAYPGQTLELFDGRIDLVGQGRLRVGSVVNPSLVSIGAGATFSSDDRWNLGYATDSSVALRTVYGDLELGQAGSTTYFQTTNAQRQRLFFLPPTVSMHSGRDIVLAQDFYLSPAPLGQLAIRAERDIKARQPGGAATRLVMADLNPSAAYDIHDGSKDVIERDIIGQIVVATNGDLIHRNDEVPARVEAGGTIDALGLAVPKEVSVRAGDDIVDLYYIAQHKSAADVSRIEAGGAIVYKTDPNASNPVKAITQGGPGTLYISAVDGIDLGTSEGIVHVGSVNNPRIVSEPGAVIVVAGMAYSLTASETSTLFSRLEEVGIEYSRLLLEGRTEEAQQAVDGVRADILGILLRGGIDNAEQARLGLQQAGLKIHDLASAAESRGDGRALAVLAEVENLLVRSSDIDTGKEETARQGLREVGAEMQGLVDRLASASLGEEEESQLVLAGVKLKVLDRMLAGAETRRSDIDMVKSKIAATSGGADIYVFATGDFNVGLSTFPVPGKETRETGVVTAGGGGINILTDGDINVNESRVMTALGGDILVWTDSGNLNAGRGAKTAVSTPRANLVANPDDPLNPLRLYETPAVGSGIRTAAYDPDGPDQPRQAPEAGDVALFAPEGEIDAGEAGIAGKNVILGATKVINAQNISFSQGGVGVPAVGDTAVAIAAPTGTGDVSAAQKMAEGTEALQGAGERLAENVARMAEAFNIKWMRVEFIGFGGDEEEEDQGG
ncbi:MAG: filamentous hemagglutinin family protein [Thermodesulfobacteriota bacterium]